MVIVKQFIKLLICVLSLNDLSSLSYSFSRFLFISPSIPIHLISNIFSSVSINSLCTIFCWYIYFFDFSKFFLLIISINETCIKAIPNAKIVNLLEMRSMANIHIIEVTLCIITFPKPFVIKSFN